MTNATYSSIMSAQNEGLDEEPVLGGAGEWISYKVPIRETRHGRGHSLEGATLRTKSFFLHLLVNHDGNPPKNPVLEKVEISCGRCDWQEMSHGQVLRAMEEYVSQVCPSSDSGLGDIASFRFTTPYCPPSLKDDKLLQIVPRLLPTLRHFEVHDGLAGYAKSWATMFLSDSTNETANLIETLSLRDVSHGTPLPDKDCQVLANVILDQLPNLQVFQLHHVRFESELGLQSILDALSTKQHLHQVHMSHLTTVQDHRKDMSKSLLLRHKPLQEQLAMMACLRQLYPQHKGLFSMKQRIRGLYLLRQGTKLTSDIYQSLAALSDRTELTYYLLRREVDPGVWSCTRTH